MPMALRVNDGVVTKNRVDEGEAAQYRALEKAVRAEEARKKEVERERRVSWGLPAEEEKVGFLKGWWRKVKGQDRDKKQREEGLIGCGPVDGRLSGGTGRDDDRVVR